MSEFIGHNHILFGSFDTSLSIVLGSLLIPGSEATEDGIADILYAPCFDRRLDFEGSNTCNLFKPT